MAADYVLMAAWELILAVSGTTDEQTAAVAAPPTKQLRAARLEPKFSPRSFAALLRLA